MTDDTKKSKKQLSDELKILKNRIKELEKSGESAVPSSESPSKDTDNLFQINTLLNSFTSDINGVVFAADKEGVFKLSDGRSLKKLGLKPGEAVGQSVYELFGDYPEIIKDFDRVYSGKEFTSIVEVDGLFFETNYKPLFDHTGEIAGVLGISHDITDLKHAENEIRESENKYRSFFKHAGFLMSVYDRSDKIIAINDHAAKSLGKKPDDIIGKKLKDIFPEFPDYFQQRVRDVINTGEIRHFEEKIFIPTGEKWLISSIIPMRDKNGLVTSAQIISHDFTKEKETTRNLELQEERFKTFFSSISDAILVHPLSEEGFAPFQEVNQVAIDRYGYSREEWMNLTAVDITEEKLTEKHFKDFYNTLLKNRRFETSEVIHIKKSGEKFPVEIRSTVIDQFESPIILTIIRDITEKRKAEDERTKLYNQLIHAQKMESIGRLAGGVAHDFNNMLAVILGNAELALSKLDEKNPIYADINEIINTTNRSANLTRQLLAFARQQTITPKVLELNQEISGMLKMLQRLIGENINLHWHPEDNLWPVKLDPAQVDQILANLCVNARDAITDSGNIIIETHNVTIDEAYCYDNPGFLPGDFVMFAVSDDGKGMDQEVLRNLFEPFYTTKATHEGTGLGLATVFGIVKQNKGFINVYSELEKGSTFKIFLARHTDSVAPKPITENNVSPILGDANILLVEDEPTILRLGKRMLESLNYTVITADSPKNAIKLCETKKCGIDLLITDVVLPEMNGRELSNKLTSYYPEMKTLFMSGYTSDVIAHHGVLEEGVNFIQKPFTSQTLSEKVKSVLES